MLWNRKGFFGTVKFRVALWYAVLFILSSLVCFLLTFAYQKRNLDARMDRILRNWADTIRMEYLAGGRAKRLGREIPLMRIPVSHLDAYYEKFPGLRPLIAFENPSLGQVHYNLIGASGGDLFLLRYDGKNLYSQQINKESNFAVVKKTIVERVLYSGSQNVFYSVLAADGETIAESSNIDLFRPALGRLRGEERYVNLNTLAGAFRVITETLYDGTTVRIGYTLRQTRENLEEFALLFWVVTAIILLPGMICGWLIARGFVSGIRRVSDAAARIAEGDFSQRVEQKNDGAEIDDLVSVFNAMTANTEHLLTELRDVTDNVAHDLRTPLTRIRTIAEITISGPQDLASYRDAIIDIAEDSSGMIAMINSMLEITRIENNFEALKTSTFSLSAQLRQAYEIFSMQAEEKNLEFTLSLPDHDVMIDADKLKLQRVISNLLDNAVKFTPENGRVALSLTEEPDALVIASPTPESEFPTPTKNTSSNVSSARTRVGPSPETVWVFPWSMPLSSRTARRSRSPIPRAAGPPSRSVSADPSPPPLPDRRRRVFLLRSCLFARQDRNHLFLKIPVAPLRKIEAFANLL